jgi:hypothetical protein
MIKLSDDNDSTNNYDEIFETYSKIWKEVTPTYSLPPSSKNLNENVFRDSTK